MGKLMFPIRNGWGFFLDFTRFLSTFAMVIPRASPLGLYLSYGKGYGIKNFLDY